MPPVSYYGIHGCFIFLFIYILASAKEKENGKIVSPPDIFCNYHHPYYEDIDKIKRKK